jgi:hypothetical protein
VLGGAVSVDPPWPFVDADSAGALVSGVVATWTGDDAAAAGVVTSAVAVDSVGASAGADGCWGAAVLADDTAFFAGAVFVAGPADPSDSFNLRTTGASTVEEADRTNSPRSPSLVMMTLLSTPSSFASS